MNNRNRTLLSIKCCYEARISELYLYGNSIPAVLMNVRNVICVENKEKGKRKERESEDKQAKTFINHRLESLLKERFCVIVLFTAL